MGFYKYMNSIKISICVKHLKWTIYYDMILCYKVYTGEDIEGIRIAFNSSK